MIITIGRSILMIRVVIRLLMIQAITLITIRIALRTVTQTNHDCNNHFVFSKQIKPHQQTDNNNTVVGLVRGATNEKCETSNA